MRCRRCKLLQSGKNEFCINCGRELANKKPCPACGKKIKVGLAKCNKCGHVLIPDATCKKCGTENPGTNSFCSSCGEKIERDIDEKK